ncbi:YALI0C11627p [Yarrowia lipolytica CLIB122]|uniref:YALI0C11627p n=2 Tax=Yarrowia lipolytica TaxID=4952 RepID=Q6CC81_YARLI|nr:YALI0C11627p [Yarrowia lipolytica CLIB122]KAB8282414.1 hypothetical protein BKA91DRAFT_162799 [Yarrowia lipolytica]KAE8169724.1 hypothetical protein BKA90DRAFT_159036 [Yarrowia lipolytica]KAJ8053349.1 hypothetical protein LXG23DRAFT_49598 [Yarrowia lipolytica]RMI95367.1 hypothetical protein BD777DRAFT_91801 [Yarrowia lipolytica]CAG82041.1 YALI0C11627p [Yarrowia lipolytica CLIB122]|eukprot:XP_501731.1 YALI0C11627p [Yarrowia lipolytica CLIB122]
MLSLAWTTLTETNSLCISSEHVPNLTSLIRVLLRPRYSHRHGNYIMNPPSNPTPPQDNKKAEISGPTDDEITMFPARDSHQRSQAVKSSDRLPPPTSNRPIPTPQPNISRTPAPGRFPATSSLRVPPPGTGTVGVGGLTQPSGASKAREKVVLQPGYSPLDWAKLRNSGKNLRGVDTMGPVRVTKDMLKEHRSKEDAWMVLNGKVYNITPYLNFHPGGVPKLMVCAGRDGTSLFMKTHAWVNYENILDRCFVGFYVG